VAVTLKTIKWEGIQRIVTDWGGIKRFIDYLTPFVFYPTFAIALVVIGLLKNGERLLLTPKSDRDSNIRLLFGDGFVDMLGIWAVLMIWSFVYLYGSYWRQRPTVARKAGFVVLAMIWFTFQMETFSRATGFLALRNMGVPELEIMPPTQAHLSKDKSRVFLLGETPDRLALLTINKSDGKRTIIAVRKEQLPNFTITAHHVNVLQNPIRPLP
jgi:hypothetical protein